MANTHCWRCNQARTPMHHRGTCPLRLWCHPCADGEHLHHRRRLTPPCPCPLHLGV